jgi:hypothetical protein
LIVPGLAGRLQISGQLDLEALAMVVAGSVSGVPLVGRAAPQRAPF